MIAFKYFEEKQVDYAVLEVGIGGTLDSTNIVMPELSIITSVGLDHTELLGDTVEEISKEKMGVFKPNTPLIIGPDCPQSHMREYLEVEKGVDNNLLHFIEKSEDCSPNFQVENNEIIKKAVQLLNREKEIISKDVLDQVLSLSVEGRFQQMSERVFFDACHNPSGFKKSIHTLVSMLQEGDPKKIVLICGFTREKNVDTNISTILNHPETDKIKSVILVESEPGEPEFIHYQAD